MAHHDSAADVAVLAVHGGRAWLALGLERRHSVRVARSVRGALPHLHDRRDRGRRDQRDARRRVASGSDSRRDRGAPSAGVCGSIGAAAINRAAAVVAADLLRGADRDDHK